MEGWKNVVAGAATGRQETKRMNKRDMKIWEKKNGKRQLVWCGWKTRFTEESFMHCHLQTRKSDKGTGRTRIELRKLG